MGLALGTGAHMQELRRTRSGAFGEEGMHTLHDVQDAAVAAQAKSPSALHAMVLSVDAAVPDLPVVVIRDAAIDAICRGAQLAGVGVVSMREFRQGDTVAVLSLKNEFVCLGKALVPSTAFKPGDTGIVIAPTTVFLQPGTYPRGWTKSGKVWPEKKKQPKKPEKKPAGRQGGRTDRKQYWKTGARPAPGSRKKGYH